jgi:hypothetical protein
VDSSDIPITHPILEFLPFDALKIRMHHSHVKRKETDMKGNRPIVIHLPRAPGQCFRLQRRGVAVPQAFDDASVSFA